MPMEQKEKVFAQLDKMQIPYDIVNHTAVFNIQEMELLSLAHMDKVVKNLFVRDDKKRRYYLVVVQKDKSVNLKELRGKIESRPLTFASEDDLYKYLKLGKGEVSPFGALNDTDNAVTVIIDNDLKGYEFIGVHPNDNTATVFVSLGDLIKILDAKGQKIMFADL